MSSHPKNLVYFGSPDFAAQILESIISTIPQVNVVAVVTNPDKPVGRKQALTPSPVARTAQNYHLPIFKPHSLDSNNLAHLKLLNPDLFLVVAYGKIIPQTWLDAPSLSTLNLHFSLLPKYRGALCIQEAIKNQDVTTGVTLMEMDDQLDHGPIISSIDQGIDLTDNVDSLTTKLTLKSIDLLTTSLPLYIDQKLTPTPQDHTQATFTPSYKNHTRQNAFIPWTQIKEALAGKDAATTHALIRSLNPDPGAWTSVDTNHGPIDLKLIQTHLDQATLVLTLVQIPGKSPISWDQFTSGHILTD